MDPKTIQQWLIPVSGAIGILSSSVAAWAGVAGYRLKAKAEQRLAESATAEREINLLRLFTELMSIAHARGPSQLSERAVEALIAANPTAQPGALLERAIVTMPIGVAAQDAAIASIGTLGMRHDFLRAPALQALDSLSSFKPDVVRKHLDALRECIHINS